MASRASGAQPISMIDPHKHIEKKRAVGRIATSGANLIIGAPSASEFIRIYEYKLQAEAGPVTADVMEGAVLFDPWHLEAASDGIFVKTSGMPIDALDVANGTAVNVDLSDAISVNYRFIYRILPATER